MKRPNVLMIAPGCDGNDVGESWSCFQWVAGMSRQADVTLLTLRRKHQVAMQQQLPHVKVVDWSDLPFVHRFERFNSLAKPGYFHFFVKSRCWIKQQLSSGQRFDLVHQVGPLALRYPSPAAGLGLPLIIGPLAGSIATPEAFKSECGQSSWYCRFRCVDHWRLRNDPMLRHTYRSADLVIGVAPYVKELLDEVGLRRFALESETGVLSVAPESHARRSKNGSMRLLYVGRLIRTKGLRDVIRAMGQLHDLDSVSLDVAGDGEEWAACNEEANRLGVAERVRFHGKVSRDQVEALYQRSDAFVFPSFREPSGNVVFEAMRNGLPVITTKSGGPGYVVDKHSGVRLNASKPDQLAADLANTIRSLAFDVDRIERLSRGARQRVAEIGLWPAKLDRMGDFYRSVLPPSRTLKEQRQQ
ncbi:MAG: glycosyltransferase family 4 protein [Planctomycetota bacterium]